MTRFYLPSTAEPIEVTPAYSESWSATTWAGRQALINDKTEVLDNGGLIGYGTGHPYSGNFLARQYVSDPLPAQRLEGSFSGVIAADANSDATQSHIVVVVSVRSDDGATTRGVLFSGEVGAQIYRYGPASVPFTGELAPVDVHTGDRLVVEIGVSRNTTTTSSSGVVLRAYGPQSDFPYVWGDNNYLSRNPWVEFSADVFNPPAPPAPSPNASRLERLFGGCPLEVTVAGEPVGTGRQGMVTITRGRDSYDTRVAASVCTMELRYYPGDPLPTVGDTVTVDLGDAAATYYNVTGTAAVRRFTGRITDPVLTPVVANGAVTGRLQITAVGPKATLGRFRVGETAWPAEPDDARAARILDAAVDLDTTGTVVRGATDPAVYAVAARDPAPATALAAIDAHAGDVSGECAETRAGALVWQSAEHRRDMPTSLTLDACSVIAAGTQWGMDPDGVVNDLTVTYGNPAQTVQVTDPAAMTGPIGRMDAEVTSTLADTLEATSWATDVVGRRARPRWRMPALAVDLTRSVTQAEAAALLAAETPALLELINLPDVAPATMAADGRLFIEGTAEQYTRDAITYDMAVTAHAMTGPAPRWMDVDPAITWADVPTDLSWLGATSWQPTP